MLNIMSAVASSLEPTFMHMVEGRVSSWPSPHLGAIYTEKGYQ